MDDLVCKSRGNDLGVRGGGKDMAASLVLIAQLVGVDEIAVVNDRERVGPRNRKLNGWMFSGFEPPVVGYRTWPRPVLPESAVKVSALENISETRS